MPTFKPPTAGELRTRIAVLQITKTNDGSGHYSETPQPLLECWAKMEAWKGMKQLQAMQINPSQWWEVTIRFPPNIPIQRKMRLKDLTTGETYEIMSAVDPDRHRHWLYMTVISAKD